MFNRFPKWGGISTSDRGTASEVNCVLSCSHANQESCCCIHYPWYINFVVLRKGKGVLKTIKEKSQ